MSEFYNGERIQKNHILLINFGTDKPSVFKVLKADRKNETLMVRVIADHYKEPYTIGEVIDIGTMIYAGYWCFEKGQNDIEKLYHKLGIMSKNLKGEL